MHHAYLIVGSALKAREFIEEKFGTLRGSPDFFQYNEALFGIDEARGLSAASVRKSFGERKIFLIAPEKITLEAQNALLKTFEDPVADTHFFLVVKDEGVIIPTLRSRMSAIRLGSNSEESEAKRFLKLSIKERMNFIKKFVDAEKNVSTFLDELITALRENQNALKELYPLRLVSDARGASARLILEHLAVVL